MYACIDWEELCVLKFKLSQTNNNLEGETVLTYIGVQYAICHTLLDA
jgi:hypothetical protein